MLMFGRKDGMAYRQKGIERFVEAQKRDYETALSEIRAGHKETHWIWYVFPQMLGLGHSCYSPDDVFAEVLDAYYGGARCAKTLELLGNAGL